MKIASASDWPHAKTSKCWSPLRWMGGKSRAIKLIAPYIPPNLPRLISPFFGGGSLEIAVGCSGVQVTGFDLDNSLVTFWDCLLSEPQKLADAAEAELPVSQARFKQLKATIFDLSVDPLTRAMAFFVVNRTARGGNMKNGSFHKINDRFNLNNIRRLREFQCPGLQVKCADALEIIPCYPDDFLYLDPPYPMISEIYLGHKTFNHEGLASLLRNRDNWILSNHDCEMVRDLYSGFCIRSVDWSYSVSSRRDAGGKSSSEVLIMSADIARRALA